jgi:ADP-dependent NAD(P)H-hydrate dehydratase / NAD(P)H-hydrate epimerase
MSCRVCRTFFLKGSELGWLSSLVMIKILNTNQIKDIDAYTIKNEPIASIDLMERACRAFCSWFTDRVEPSKKIGIVCGTGNNGGDGLGIARQLKSWDYPVQVWIVKGGVAESGDFKINLSRLEGIVDVHYLEKGLAQDVFADCDVLIDAIFGSGLSRAPEGIYADVIEKINQANAIRMAVDVPSGLLADKPSSGIIVKAHYTLSFQLPKLAFLLPSCHEFVGTWCTVDIGLSKAGIENAVTDHFLLTKKSIARLLKPLQKFDHKGNRGHALLIAGGYGKMGAAVLAGRAALRTGIGLLTVHVPKTGYPIIQASVPEAMVSMDQSEYVFSSAPDLSAYDALGIGPGLGMDSATVKGLGDVLSTYGRPVVLDADALNILGAHRELLQVIPKGSVLTPHPKEFERIAGSWKNDFERLEKQKEFAVAHSIVVVLKGAHTSVTSPEGKAFFNNTGNPGMATGGMGDALTGIITALLAAGHAPLEAAQAGVWIHGMAGDEATQQHGMRGMIASDVIDHLPSAFRGLA